MQTNHKPTDVGLRHCVNSTDAEPESLLGADAIPSQEEALSALVKHHGWTWACAGVLRKWRFE